MVAFTSSGIKAKTSLLLGFLIMCLSGTVSAQQPIPSGCLQSWQERLSLYQRHCAELTLITSTTKPEVVLAPAIAAGADLMFATVLKCMNESAAYGPDSDAVSFSNNMDPPTMLWISRGGYSIGYYQLFRNNSLWVYGHTQWTGVKFLDNDFEEKVNPGRPLSCKAMPEYVALSPKQDIIIEGNATSSVIAVWKYLQCSSAPAPFRPLGCWCRLIFIKERPECASLSKEQQEQVLSADLKALAK